MTRRAALVGSIVVVVALVVAVLAVGLSAASCGAWTSPAGIAVVRAHRLNRDDRTRSTWGADAALTASRPLATTPFAHHDSARDIGPHLGVLIFRSARSSPKRHPPPRPDAGPSNGSTARISRMVVDPAEVAGRIVELDQRVALMTSRQNDGSSRPASST